MPKSHERRIHGHRHAGVQIVQDGPTSGSRAQFAPPHPQPFTPDDLLPYRTARGETTLPNSSTEPTQGHEKGAIEKSSSKSFWPSLKGAIAKHVRLAHCQVIEFINCRIGAFWHAVWLVIWAARERIFRHRQEAAMITRYPRPVEEAMRYTFSTLNERQRGILSVGGPGTRTWRNLLFMARLLECHRREGPLSAGLSELRHPDSLLPPHRAQKKGWPPTLFDSFSRNRQGLSTNRRSPHSGRSRPRRRSLDQPFASQDCRGTSAARLSRECHRCVSASPTSSIGKSQGLRERLPLGHHVNRDRQFQIIANHRTAFMHSPNPIVRHRSQTQRVFGALTTAGPALHAKGQEGPGP